MIISYVSDEENIKSDNGPNTKAPIKKVLKERHNTSKKYFEENILLAFDVNFYFKKLVFL